MKTRRRLRPCPECSGTQFVLKARSPFELDLSSRADVLECGQCGQLVDLLNLDLSDIVLPSDLAKRYANVLAFPKDT